MYDFFYIYVDCIPHSIYDESFMVFDLMLKHVSNQLEESLISVIIHLIYLLYF